MQTASLGRVLTPLRSGTIIKRKEIKLRQKTVAGNARKHSVTVRCIRHTGDLEEFQDFGAFIMVLVGMDWTP